MLFQNRFNQAIKFLCAVIKNRSNLNVLNCIRVTQRKDYVKYEVTDIDNYVRVKLPIWTEVTGDYLVEAKTFLKVKNKVASNITNEKVQFGKISIPSFDVKEFPLLQSGFLKTVESEFNSVSKNELVNAGKRLCNYVASTDDGRSVIQCICMQNKYFYATDGHAGLRYANSIKLKNGSEYVIPVPFFRHLANDFILDDTVDITVYKAGGSTKYMVARGMSFEIITKLCDEGYPKIETFIPKEFKFSFTVPKEKFQKVLKETTEYANSRGNFLTKLSTQKNNQLLVLNVNNPENGIEFEDSIPVEASNKKAWNGAGVNSKILLTILNDCIGSNIEMKFTDSHMKPVAIQPTNEKEFFFIMPLRITEEPDEKEEQKTETSNNDKEEVKTK